MVLTHYGSSMRPEILMDEALSIIEHLAKRFSKNDKLILFYSGMSGTASASALVTLNAFLKKRDDINLPVISGMVYVRKENEDSHGNKIEVSIVENFDNTDRLIPIFIDDFVCYGRTFLYVKKQVAKFVKKNNGLFSGSEHLDNCEKFFNKLSRKKNWWIAEVDRKTLKHASKVKIYA